MTELPDGMRVENWTAHEVLLLDPATKEQWRIPMEQRAPLRLNTKRERMGRFLQRVTFEEPAYEPVPQPGVMLIVSSPVKLALNYRDDLVTPNDLVRGVGGNVVACKGFAL